MHEKTVFKSSVIQTMSEKVKFSTLNQDVASCSDLAVLDIPHPDFLDIPLSDVLQPRTQET